MPGATDKYLKGPDQGWGGLQARIVGSDVFAPVFRRGSHLLLDPKCSCSTGDAVAITAKNGDVYLGFLTNVTRGRWTITVAGSMAERTFRDPELRNISKIRAVVFA